MDNLIQLVIFLLVFVAALGALREAYKDPRVSRAFWWRSWRVVGGYFAFVAVGIGLLLWLEHRINAVAVTANESAHISLAVFMLGWIGLAVLWLIRLTPNLKQPSAWLIKRWGWLDGVMIAMILFSALQVLVN